LALKTNITQESNEPL